MCIGEPQVKYDLDSNGKWLYYIERPIKLAEMITWITGGLRV